ncbi:hypothetical protein Y017_14435 [Alcanivorax sp. 97CO-5]|nr:hypothetical protein Y017_14435 [Alcanivorax sp. 97CO-5]
MVKAKQHQSLLFLDSLFAAQFVSGFAILHKLTNNNSAVIGSVTGIHKEEA